MKAVDGLAVHVLATAVDGRRREGRNEEIARFFLNLMLAELADMVAKVPVIGAELLAPRRDDVRFIDNDGAERAIADKLLDVTAREQRLGRKVQDIIRAILDLCHDLLLLNRRDVGVDRRRTGIRAAFEAGDLVVHEADERRDDERHELLLFREDHRGDLEHRGLARARRRRDEKVARLLAAPARLGLLHELRDDGLLRDRAELLLPTRERRKIVYLEGAEGIGVPVRLQELGIDGAMLERLRRRGFLGENELHVRDGREQHEPLLQSLLPTGIICDAQRDWACRFFQYLAHEREVVRLVEQVPRLFRFLRRQLPRDFVEQRLVKDFRRRLLLGVRGIEAAVLLEERAVNPHRVLRRPQVRLLAGIRIEMREECRAHVRRPRGRDGVCVDVEIVPHDHDFGELCQKIRLQQPVFFDEQHVALFRDDLLREIVNRMRKQRRPVNRGELGGECVRQYRQRHALEHDDRVRFALEVLDFRCDVGLDVHDMPLSI